MSTTRTATLNGWLVRYYASQERYILEGTVYDDSDGEFPDGVYVSTNFISNFEFPYKKLMRGSTVTTSTGSQYTLGARWQG